MAKIFLKTLNELAAVTNAVAGDEYYIATPGTVYDTVATKLVMGYDAFKVNSGVWAVLNKTKSVSFGFGCLPVWSSTVGYEKGTLILKDSNVWSANDTIASGTAWDSAKWDMFESPPIETKGITPTCSTRFGGCTFLFKDDNFKMPYDGFIYEFTIGTAEGNLSGLTTGVFSSSDGTNIKRMFTQGGQTLTKNVLKTFSGGNLFVPSGEWVGVICFNSTAGFVGYGGSYTGITGYYTKNTAVGNYIAGMKNNSSWKPVYGPNFSFNIIKA